MTRKGKAIIEIENLQGRFVQFWNAGRFDLDTHLFLPGNETWFARPDFGERFTGKEAVDAWFFSKYENINPDPLVRNFQLCHTPAIEVDEDLIHARASFMVTAFDIRSAENGQPDGETERVTMSEKKNTVQNGYVSEQWEARYDADLVMHEGRWYYRTLQFYILMSLYPEKSK